MVSTPSLEQDVSSKCAPVLNGRALKPLDGNPSLSDARNDIRLEACPTRVIVRLVTLILEIDEQLREGTYGRREGDHLSFLPARFSRPAVVERAVRAPPWSRAPHCTAAADDCIRATLRQAMKERVVDGARRAAKIGFQGPAAPAGQLPLGRRQEVRRLQVASPSRRTS